MFRALAAAHLDRFDPRPLRPPSGPVQATNLRALYTEVLRRIEPTETFAAEVRLVVDRGGATDDSDERALDDAMFTPRFAQPLAPALAELGQDLLLPGLEGVPPNSDNLPHLAEEERRQPARMTEECPVGCLCAQPTFRYRHCRHASPPMSDGQATEHWALGPLGPAC